METGVFSCPGKENSLLDFPHPHKRGKNCPQAVGCGYFRLLNSYLVMRLIILTQISVSIPAPQYSIFQSKDSIVLNIFVPSKAHCFSLKLCSFLFHHILTYLPASCLLNLMAEQREEKPGPSLAPKRAYNQQHKLKLNF